MQEGETVYLGNQAQVSTSRQHFSREVTKDHVGKINLFTFNFLGEDSAGKEHRHIFFCILQPLSVILGNTQEDREQHSEKALGMVEQCLVFLPLFLSKKKCLKR